MMKTKNLLKIKFHSLYFSHITHPHSVCVCADPVSGRADPVHRGRGERHPAAEPPPAGAGADGQAGALHQHRHQH